MASPGQTQGSTRSSWRPDTGRLQLQKLNHPCLQSLQGPLSSYFAEPTLAEKYPPFASLTPREKAASPRIPRALHALYEKPQAETSLVDKWMSGLPRNEKLLRQALSEKIPGSQDPPCSPRQPMEPHEKLLQRRKDQAERLEVLIKKVTPSKHAEDPVLKAAAVKLQRLQGPPPSTLEPLQEQSQENAGEAAPGEALVEEAPPPDALEQVLTEAKKVSEEFPAKDDFAWNASQQRSL